MTRFETFDQDIRLATADLEPEAISRELAKFARATLAEVIASGEGSPIYEKFVNSRAGAEEETVVAPGPIVYDFSWWTEIIEFALEFLRKRSPRKSGEFQNAWFVMVNGARVADWEAVPVGATVIVTNDRPYARKVEVGHVKMSVPHGVAEAGRLAVRRQYGAIVEVKKTMITLPGGYILKGRFTKGVRQFSRTVLRKDTAAGQAVTYPALVISMKV